jgi:hypothetical protein
MGGAIPLLPSVLSGLVRRIMSRDSVDGVKTRWSFRRIPMGERDFSHPDRQTDPGAHPASCTVGSGGKVAGHGVDTNPHLAVRLKKE